MSGSRCAHLRGQRRPLPPLRPPLVPGDGSDALQCGQQGLGDPSAPAADGVGTAGEADGVVLPRGPPAAPLEPAPHGFSVSLHPGPTGVCGFGGPYGDTVATGAYRAFRAAAAAGHCGAFPGGDSGRTGKSQGGNYATSPPPRASPPRLAPSAPSLPGPLPAPAAPRSLLSSGAGGRPRSPCGRPQRRLPGEAGRPQCSGVGSFPTAEAPRPQQLPVRKLAFSAACFVGDVFEKDLIPPT